eukprot:TRINITY_DN7211_c0_g1_i1.p2 TRINITY_DN7211_c0_g1~~TRINITY_DN7211_c0_g1_i1.p2  ORF type:complete len:192 (+),score=10.11 TRINITY_DN7211_c0_g1_i1:54-629(+)
MGPGVTEAFGGSGGNSFSEHHAVSWGCVTRIAVSHTHLVRFLALTYDNGISRGYPRESDGFYSRWKPPLAVTNLDANERVTGVSGFVGDVLHQITFTTNKRVLGPYGDADFKNLRPFSVDFGVGNELLYLHGSVEAGSITRIGFGYGRPLDQPVSAWEYDGNGQPLVRGVTPRKARPVTESTEDSCGCTVC